MSVSDKILGLILLLASGVIFVYYTIWVLILVSILCKMHIVFLQSHNLIFHPPPQPFVEEPAVLNLFPPRIYAIAIPAFVLVLAISIIGAFIGTVLIKESKKKKSK